MYRTFARILIGSALAAMTAAFIAMFIAILSGEQHPKHVGGTIAVGIEVVALIALIPFAPKHPTLALVLTGGIGVTLSMIAAVEQSGLAWTPFALTAAIILLFATAVWSGVELVDRRQHDTRSYF